MNDVIVKSYVKGRARIYLKNANANIFEKVKQKLSPSTLHVRINLKCKSLIVHFDENKLKLDTLISLIDTCTLKKTITHSSVACKVCTSPTNIKKSTLTFGLLSGYCVALISGFAIPAYITLGVSLFASIPLLKDAYEDIKQKKFTLQTFMSISLIVASFLGEVNTAFEVIYILRGGMLLEEYATKHSINKIENLLKNDIKKVYILHENVELECELKDVKKGDIVVVRSGEKIPVDGTITYGEAQISQALINGRSESEYKSVDDKVYANTLLEIGRIFIKVDATGEDTYLSRIITQVECALLSKTQSEKAADKLANRLLKLGVFLTASTYFLTGSLLNAFSVMIVMSCPCSTILAASTAISAAIAKCAKDGILIKGGEYLEKVSQSDVFCFDKTGTLTTGKPQIKDIILADNVSEKELFQTALLAEYRNTHPLALCISEYAKSLSLHVNESVQSCLIPGLGAELKYNDDYILVGNAALFKKHKISLRAYKKQENEFTNKGKSVVYVGKNKNVLGLISFEHEAREGALNIVNELKKRGVKKVVLLTGDDENVALAFSQKYGFDNVYANVLPEQKASIVEKLKQEFNNIVMIGDGINDTIAMSKADIGISFASGGSEAAIEVSDIAITKSNIEDLLKLHDMSEKALKVVEQNYFIGTGTNLLGVLLASFGMLSPVAAGGVHIAHTVGIMANASKLAIEK